MKKLHFLVLFCISTITLFANTTSENTTTSEMMCNATYSLNGLALTVENISAPIVAVRVLELNYVTIYSCDQWSTPCGDPENITLPQEGSYFLQIQTFQDWNTPICDIFETINVVADPCANSGGDADGDGICADVDCDDNDAAIGQAGDACDDGDAITENDVIQTDCSCAGELPCANNGGDADGDGICADVDCDDNDATIGQAGDACDDGDAVTENDIIQTDCSCVGTVPPCANNGGDADGDTICADIDCDDNDPSVGNQGAACDDGDATTENDVIQADCSCAGTPIPPSGCQTTYSLNGLELTITPIDANINAVKVLYPNYTVVFSCDQWSTPCNTTEVITLPAEGDYFVQIQTYEDWSTPICDIFESITAVAETCPNTGDTDGDGVCDDIDCDINDPAISQPGDVCDDGDAATENDIILMDCSCAGELPCANNGGDADGDGVCADVDCDDTDPLVSNLGDACDDGDANTENDVIHANCDCAGTLIPCSANGGDADGDGVCADVDCDDNDPLISTEGDLCNDGDSTTVNDLILADCSCAGTIPPSCDNNGGDADSDGVCADVDCDDNDPLVSNEGDTCDDGDANTENDVIQADCSCAGTLIPCINNGGDADSDGVCADVDCDDNDPLVSNEGDICDDGDANTENDAIQADCSCVGTPVDPTACNVTYTVVDNVITINNIVGTYTSVKILDANYGTDFTCDDWTTPCDENLVITISGFGNYFIQVQTFVDWNTPICDILDPIVLSDPNTGNPCDNNGGDADGDGFCADIDCDDNDPLIRQTGDLCDDGDSTTTNDIIISGCICQGTIPNACVQAGGDIDADGICAEDDCDDTNASIGMVGETCDDGNPNTENDIRMSDCSCMGTPVAMSDTCNVTYTLVGNVITINNVTAPIHSVQILDENFGLEYACNSWDLPCDATISRPINAVGTYFLQIQTYTDWNSPAICDLFETIIISDTDPCMNNGGDADGDGFCADVDCDDNDPLFNQPGDICNDGDPTTENDIIQADCACAGTPCDNVTDGGQISGDETLCPEDTPTPILSDTPATGGTGTIEYQWLSSTSSCPMSIFDAIDGATQSSYTPANISETTYYRRVSRRDGCGDWMQGESNCVVKTIDSACDPTASCTAAYTINGGELTVTGIDYPIVSVKVLSQANFAVIYSCDQWTTPCSNPLITNLAPDDYFLQIQTYETWTDLKCDIFESFTITGAARASNSSNNFEKEKSNVQSNEVGKKPFVFPNPAQSTINISLTDYIGKNIEIQLIDQLGKRQKVISMNSISNPLVSIPLGGVQSGIYTVSIATDGMAPIAQRVIVRKD